jgi:hypothetical protein
MEDLMDEKRTLSILGWVMGSLIGAIFLLNAIALSELSAPTHPSTYADSTADFGIVSPSMN